MAQRLSLENMFQKLQYSSSVQSKTYKFLTIDKFDSKEMQFINCRSNIADYE